MNFLIKGNCVKIKIAVEGKKSELWYISAAVIIFISVCAYEYLIKG